MNKTEEIIILHVEDREDSRKILKDYLIYYLKLNVKLIQCEDVISALNVLMTDQKINLAILDYNFPTGFNGDSLTGILKSKNIPAVYYTATFKEQMNNCQFPLFHKGFDEKNLISYLLKTIKKEFKTNDDLKQEQQNRNNN